MAMTVAATTSFSKPLERMIVTKPAQIVNNTKSRTLLLVIIVFHTVTMAIAMLLLSKQSWYSGVSYHNRQVSSTLLLCYAALCSVVLCCMAWGCHMACRDC